MLLLRLSFASSAGGLRSNIAKRQRTRLFAVYVSKAIFQREGSSDLDTAALRAIAFLMPLLPPVTSGLFRRVLAYRILLHQLTEVSDRSPHGLQSSWLVPSHASEYGQRPRQLRNYRHHTENFQCNRFVSDQCCAGTSRFNIYAFCK